MTMTRMPCLLTALALAMPLVATGGSPVRAQAAYEGNWSVLVVTEKGDCDRAFRYAVKVEKGALVYVGEPGVDFTGRVDRGGRVTVQVRRGEQGADGAGRLSRNTGVGTWKGLSKNSQCSGRWEAEKR
jgi:hypothetical protein